MKNRSLNVRLLPGSRRTGLAVALLSLLAMSGCGIAQAVGDGTVDAARWVFDTRIGTMNVDLSGRAELNPDVRGHSLSTVVRFYQLKDATTFERLTASQLQADDLTLLRPDLLATKDVVLRPGASISVAEPMHADTRFVGVAAFFRAPAQGGGWKLTLPKRQWKRTDPVRIEVRGSELVLSGAGPRIGRDAPLQAVPVRAASSALPPT